MHRGEAGTAREPHRRASAHARAGEILERLERFDEAIGEHEHALALVPDMLPSFEALVGLLARAQRHRALIELYERQLERFDLERRIESLFAIGDLYRGPLADPEQAEFAYRRILKLRPQHLGAIHALARVAAAAGRWRSLIEALELEAGIATAPHQVADLLHRIGEILDERLERRDEAIARLRSVLALEPAHAATLATLGRIFHAEGRWADLAEIYQRELDAAADESTQVALLHKLGELHARQLANLDKATEFLRRALDLDRIAHLERELSHVEDVRLLVAVRIVASVGRVGRWVLADALLHAAAAGEHLWLCAACRDRLHFDGELEVLDELAGEEAAELRGRLVAVQPGKG